MRLRAENDRAMQPGALRVGMHGAGKRGVITHDSALPAAGTARNAVYSFFCFVSLLASFPFLLTGCSERLQWRRYQTLRVLSCNTTPMRRKAKILSAARGSPFLFPKRACKHLLSLRYYNNKKYFVFAERPLTASTV